MIDTHCHLYDAAFDADRSAVVARAQAAGVTRIIMPNEDCSTLQALLQTEAEYAGFCQSAVGLHPESVDDNYQTQLDTLREQLDRHPWVGIGEVGIDLYWDTSYLEQQKDALRQQVVWAVERDWPLIIHCRKGLQHITEVLRPFRDKAKGIFHCFSGSVEEAEQIRRLGDFRLGIGGVLTFKNSNLADTLANIPPDRIVLETDAPYLAPVPHRGERNESSFMEHVVQRLAQIYNLPPDEIKNITTKTAIILFTKP